MLCPHSTFAMPFLALAAGLRAAHSRIAIDIWTFGSRSVVCVYRRRTDSPARDSPTAPPVARKGKPAAPYGSGCHGNRNPYGGQSCDCRLRRWALRHRSMRDRLTLTGILPANQDGRGRPCLRARTLEPVCLGCSTPACQRYKTDNYETRAFSKCAWGVVEAGKARSDRLG